MMLKFEEDEDRINMLDDHEFIKIQQQSPNSQTHQDLILKFLTNFHDQSSNQQMTIEPTQQQAIQYLQNKINLRTTHITTIKETLENDDYFKQVDKNQLFNEAIKRKRILKREKAKSRHQVIHYTNTPIIEGDYQNDDEDDKKKKNRISAQISRDRKKQYVSQLQNNNKKLEKECQEVKIQNLNLKRQIQKYRKSQQKSYLHAFSETAHNKFVKLLIFLGIIFFLNSIKSVFKPEKSYRASKFKKSFIFTKAEQSQIVEGVSEISSLYNINSKQNPLSMDIQQKIKGISGNFTIPQPLSENLTAIKQQYFHSL